MIFTQDILTNSRSARAQWDEVQASRNNAMRHNRALNSAAGLAINTGLIPQDVYQDFDNVTVERMRSDDGDTFLNDLLGLQRSINIGKLVHKFRQASDAGNAQTSMTGQIGVSFDQVEYSYDGTIVPVHDAGFGRNWREWSAMQSEGFDGLIDDQRETVATVRRKAADGFLDGWTDKQGNAIVVDGLSWEGMRNDSRVAQVDIGGSGVNFDFTDNTESGTDIKAAWIQVRDVLWITNSCEMEATYYISREMASNFERKFSTSYDAKTIMQELADLMGVAAIKVSNKLIGNEFMAFPLDPNKVRPMVGMGVNTVAMPRPVYNSNYDFVTWAAIGFEIRNDFAGNTCALFAQELT